MNKRASPRLRVLVVEDEIGLALGLSNNLEIEGYEVRVAHRGSPVPRLLTQFDPHLVLLDLMLPDVDGLDLLCRLRCTSAAVRVIVVSARVDEKDRVRALDGGANDYIAKPFGLQELLARVRVQLREAIRDSGSARPVIRLEVSGRVWINDLPVQLTRKEYQLLRVLIEAKGSLVSRERLLREVWRYTTLVRTRELMSTSV